MLLPSLRKEVSAMTDIELSKDDFYEIFEDTFEDDEISAEEEGFMRGFLDS